MMIEKYYSCKLLGDVVLNSSLATEGNMQSLDYIAGSNFYGIVAASLYSNDKVIYQERKRLLHSDEVCFGDAIISDGNSAFYSMPYMYFKEKDKESASLHLHHKIACNIDYDEIQFKQVRNGYLSYKGEYIKKVQKVFQLKSAYDREKRTSEEGKMFGFEAIKKGQEFLFSILYKNEKDIEIIENALKGEKYIGKSKTAQYGKVNIISKEKVVPISSFAADDFVLIYAESNLCFFNSNGLPTYQPTINQLGLSGGEIIWKKSQIRTYTYSPWNGKRATNTMQRNCISKGSVFYVEKPAFGESIPRIIGEYVNEGLGRIILNPDFLENNGDQLKTQLIEMQIRISNDKSNPEFNSARSSSLIEKLRSLRDEKSNELLIAQKVNIAIEKIDKSLLNISSSQWGAIRAYATKAKNMDDLKTILFEGENAYLQKGVAYDRYWSKNGNIVKLRNLILDHNDSGLVFIIKLTAEIAKKVNSKAK